MGLHVRRHGFGWAVFEGQRPVSGQLSTQSLAENAMARMERKRRIRVRSCLCCGAEFASEGPHNRLCNPCRAWAGSQDRAFVG